jgi:lipopolysaccharide assembly outer membrane protein LptD (OstA)
MRLLLCVPVIALLPAMAQDSGLKHLAVAAVNGRLSTRLTALSIERETQYPSVVHLKGNVEIKSPVCLPVGKKGALVCDGYTLLRADEVDFHEDTGEIEARGSVRLSGLRHEK